MATLDKENLKIIFIITYLAVLAFLLVIYTICIFGQEKYNIPENRIRRVQQWLNSFLSVLLGYVAGVLSG